MQTAKQLKLTPTERDVLTPSGCRYYIVQTLENDDGRSLSLLTTCETEGGARQAAHHLFLERKERYDGTMFGVGVIDIEQPEYMLACRFALGTLSKK